MTQPLLCLCCPVLSPRRDNPRHPTVPQVCDPCRTRLVDDLVGIPAAYLALAIHIMPGRLGGERFTNEYESRPPLNTAALSLLGPGSDTPLARLDSWAQDWSIMLSVRLPTPTMPETCRWLLTHLQWACNLHPAVDEFASDLRDIAGALRGFGGRDRGEKVGRCPQRVGDGRCDTPLYVDPYVDQIECSRCRMVWKRRQGEWMHLRAQQSAAGVEVG